MTVTALSVFVLAFAVGIAALGLAASWYLRFAVRRMVSDKYHALEEIAGSGQVPADWVREHDVALARAGTSADQVRQVEVRSARRNIRRLDALAGHVARSTLMADDEARALLLARLAQARAPYAELLGGTSTGTGTGGRRPRRTRSASARPR